MPTDFCIYTKNYTILAFFIPLITAMGGNVGVQSSAIIVQGIASKKMGISSWTKRLIKEFNVALINGLICCTIVLIVCIVLYNLPLLALSISLSLLSVMVFAALFGTFIPLTLKKNNTLFGAIWGSLTNFEMQKICIS